MKRHFFKYHALGNDYIVIDPEVFNFLPAPEAVRLICDRNRGAGSDGILYGPLPGSDPAVPRLEIYNPDGSEAEKSGNGLRIFSLYLAEHGYRDLEPFRIQTKGGLVTAQVKSLKPALISVDMGAPSFDAQKAGLATDQVEFINQSLDAAGRQLKAVFVSMGNPHCVIFGEQPTPSLAKTLGPLIETHKLFPQRTNVQFVEILGCHDIRIEIWERGAGYTLASGSSSCAAAAASRRLGLVESPVTVHMPGGVLHLELADTITMTGPAVSVYDGAFSPAMLAELARLSAIPATAGASLAAASSARSMHSEANIHEEPSHV